MKTNYLLILVAWALLLNACNVGVNKDLLSGLKVSNNGLSYENAYLSRQHVKLTDNVFNTGDTIYLYMDGVKGYTEKDAMVYLGASLVVTDPQGKEVLNAPDVFSSYDQTGVTKEDASVMSLMLIVGPPMVSDVKYTWKSKVWDKNGKGTIDAEVEFKIK